MAYYEISERGTNDISNLKLIATYNTSGTSVNLPYGVHLLRYGCSHPDQGSHSEVCDGYNTGRTSKQHNMNWEIYGRTHIVLCDISGSRVYNLVYGSETVNKEITLDPTHAHSIITDSYGGTTTVTCPTCGYGKSFSGSATHYVQVYTNAAPEVINQLKDITQNVDYTGTFYLYAQNMTKFVWEIYIDGAWNSELAYYTDTVPPEYYWIFQEGMSFYITENISEGYSYLSIRKLRLSIDGIKVRCKMTGNNGLGFTSDEVFLNVIDNKGPTVKITKSTEKQTIFPVILTVQASDEDSGLPDSPYSFDGGKTYSSKNTFRVTRNRDVGVVVKDLEGNTTEIKVTIDNIGLPSSYKAYIGVNGKAARLKKMYIGYNGKAYPLLFETDYIKEEAIVIPSFGEASDEEIAELLEQHRAGYIDLTEHWSVGDERSVHLSDMPKTGVGENHFEQDATLVILHGPDIFDLSDGGKNIFVIGLKNCLKQNGYINSIGTNIRGWKECQRRVWCDNVFMKALPETVQSWFKKFKYLVGQGNQLTTTDELENYFTFLSKFEVFGNNNNSAAENTIQMDYYKTENNRIKKSTDSGNDVSYFLRSPSTTNDSSYNIVYYDGSEGTLNAAYSIALSPFGCV